MKRKIILIASLSCVAIVFICCVQFLNSSDSLKDSLKNIFTQSAQQAGQIIGGALKKTALDLTTTAGLAALGSVNQF